MRSILDSRSQSIDKVSEIDREISDIDKKEPENKFTDNMRSEIDKKKISQAELIKNFPKTYQFCNKDLNKSSLLLRKGVYPYEYMDSWKKFNET